jgi:hypothetical protein
VHSRTTATADSDQRAMFRAEIARSDLCHQATARDLTPLGLPGS